MNRQEPSDVHILRWFDEGNTGSATEIAEALGIKKPTVYAALMRLEGREQATVVGSRETSGTRGVGPRIEHIFGSCAGVRPTVADVVRVALQSQPALVRAWHGVAA